MMPSESPYLDGERLPSGVFVTEAGTLRIRWTVDGLTRSKTLKVPLDGEGVAEALRLRERFREHQIAGDKPQYGSPIPYAEVFAQARKRAKSKGREYTLSRMDEAAIVELSCGVCAMTGLPFSASFGGETIFNRKYKRRPYMPSLDRVDSSKGYAPGNVRLVCSAINLAMNEWGESVFKEIATSYLLHNNQRIIAESTTEKFGEMADNKENA